MKIRVCFVCLGNICRSPTAEGIMRDLVMKAGLEHAIEVSSAGTGAYHVGEGPDSRSRQTARERGITLRGRARQFVPKDFDRFDYVVAMDRENHTNLLDLAKGRESRAATSLLRSFEPGRARRTDVPDPYYGGEHGFDRVFDICESACRGLLQQIRKEHDLDS